MTPFKMAGFQTHSTSALKQTEAATTGQKSKQMTDVDRNAFLKKYNVTQSELSEYLEGQALEHGDDDIDQEQWMEAVRHLSQGKYEAPGENVDEID